ncbi:hypothetical protein C162_07859 [Paenibacillus sp. FSL R7-269]|uniref:helix-turn-helix domain-containing protein n=1 Tax=Paenibacillus sp. FSL R7-269 TaxID=1226755 RepID=UPI0003E1CC4E|nr:helix-turn-helix domain-containing protein [Paenibacillus sp. FSL R7-269]ETT53151.1 hypothetical protein C162_07859 [Paenibacillus sp. FSL R7-269]
MKPITMNTKEIAIYLNVSLDTIYKMVRAHQIPHIRLRGKILFSTISIEKWIRESEQRVTL